MKKSLILSNFDDLSAFFGEWWEMLKSHYERLEEDGWSEAVWSEVLAETGRWHLKYDATFALTMATMEHVILRWIHDREG